MSKLIDMSILELEVIRDGYLRDIENTSSRGGSTDDKITGAAEIADLHDKVHCINAEIALKEKLSGGKTTDDGIARVSIELHIVMTEAGAFVVDADANEAAERADDEFPEEDVRQIALTIELKPPSAAPEPIAVTVRIN